MKKLLSWLLGSLLLIPAVQAQQPEKELISGVNYRSVGPTRQGGRYVDFAVYEKNPSVFYTALASGGVWKTVNNGITFTSVFDDAGAISVGDLAIDQQDPNVLWVGTGEANNSRTAYYGDGIYLTRDGGKTWQNMGLNQSQHIGRILIHPENSRILWVAAEGPLYSNNEECGVYQTTNGGKSWKKVLEIKRDGKHIGVVDLAMQPDNPDVLYAAAYDKERTPWTFNAGGPASGIYKTTDGGKSWTRLSGGLPDGVIGRIGVAVSESHPHVVYANVENCNVEGLSFEERWELMKNGQPLPEGKKEDGDQMYRSDDYGATWKLAGQDVGGGPAYYYQQVVINPTDANHVYVLGMRMYETLDGGENWGRPFAFGGDNHCMWINRLNPRHIMLGYDHGMGISYDAGENWYHPDFKDVGQFVAVGYDMRHPYYVYGGMQDNGSAAGPSTKPDGSPILLEDWYRTGGGDGMYNEVDPHDWRILYNESQFGPIARHNQETGSSKSIRYRDMDRWSWNAPIVISPHNSHVIYHAGNKVVRSNNQGESWEVISHDLSTNDPVKIAGTGNIQYCTVVALDESPLMPGLLWAGTDDGKVWVTKDGGKEWNDLTDRIPGHPGYWISRLEPSHFKPGTAYLSVTGYRNDDFKPFIWKTEDYGETWTSIAANLPDEPICVIREHHQTPRLLFAGTTKQIWVSFNGGQEWLSMRNNMPFVAVEDLKIHPRENDLIAATHGRSIWIADISWLPEVNQELLNQELHVFKPENKIQYDRSGYRMNSSSSNFMGESEQPGVPFYCYFRDTLSACTLEVWEGDRLIHSEEVKPSARLETIVWNYTKRIRERTAEEKEAFEKQAERFRAYYGNRGGSRRLGDPDFITGTAGPGTYRVILTNGEKSVIQEFVVLEDVQCQ